MDLSKRGMDDDDFVFLEAVSIVFDRSSQKAASDEKEWLRRYDCVFGPTNCECKHSPMM